MQIAVELDPHHLETLGETQPLTGVVQLIWNALDADAEHVQVEFGRNELGGIAEIRVVDDGHGMTYDEITEVFKTLGGSWKLNAAASKEKQRALHGRDGRGRFLAARIGNRIHWRTVARDLNEPDVRWLTEVEITADHLDRVEVSDPERTDQPVGTRVLIDRLADHPKGLETEGAVERITGTFALYLQTYNVELKYGEDVIDPAAVQDHRQEYVVPAPGRDAGLTVIEWLRNMDRRLYLCDVHGTPLADFAPYTQAPGFIFTAYLRWEGFESDTALAVADLGSGDTKEVIEAAREQLTAHFKERAEEKRRQQIEEWRQERVYPYEGEPATEAEQATREVFDVVALAAGSVVNSSDRDGRRLSLRLLREALESGPESLHRVLSEVLELSEERVEELSALLDRTPLSNMIAVSKEIGDRLEFIQSLDELVLGNDARHVKERSQLHRILADETWMFGEPVRNRLGSRSLLGLEPEGQATSLRAMPPFELNLR